MPISNSEKNSAITNAYVSAAFISYKAQRCPSSAAFPTLPAPMSLTTLPDEVLNDIAFALVASSPLGPPSDLIPLLCTSKPINKALHFKKNTGLYARIARLKFDCNAVKRRAFKPFAKDCAEHLVHSCLCLQFFRRGDVDDEDDIEHLPTAFMLMLENDGKNRAQLEWAGIESFLDQYMRRRLYENRMTNDGWPLETPHGSSALWLTWMFATKGQ